MEKREIVAMFVTMGGKFPDEYLPRLDACPDADVKLVTKFHYEPCTEHGPECTHAQHVATTTTLNIGAGLTFMLDRVRVRPGDDE
jgi:hypothetical protein